jgi:lipoprotein-anchoring transpeptidase ErfK/SrfK
MPETVRWVEPPQWTGPRAVAVAAVGLCLAIYVCDLALSQSAAGTSCRQGASGAYVPYCPGEGYVPAAEDGAPVLNDSAIGEGGADLHDNELWKLVQGVRKGLEPMMLGKRRDTVAFVPARALADFLGARLRWPASGGAAAATPLATAPAATAPAATAPAAFITGAGVLMLTPGQPVGMFNRRNLKLVAAPWVDGGELQVPILSVCETYGLAADWDEATHTYSIKHGDKKLTVIMEAEQFTFEVARSGPWLKVSYAGKLVKQYPICSGEGQNTPVGHFEIQNKCEWPPWNAYWGEYMPGGSSRNPLGARWLGTTAYGKATGRTIGIHGTNEPSSIGRRISGGCMRCQNHDIIELYEVIPVGTPVWIHE